MSRYRIEDGDGAWYVKDGMTDRIVEVHETFEDAQSALLRASLGLLPSPSRVAPPRAAVIDASKSPLRGG